MVGDGWFPFVEILASDFKALSRAYESKFNLEHTVNGIVDRFNEERVRQVTDKWWRNQHFLEKKVLIQAALRHI